MSSTTIAPHGLHGGASSACHHDSDYEHESSTEFEDSDTETRPRQDNELEKDTINDQKRKTIARSKNARDYVERMVNRKLIEKLKNEIRKEISKKRTIGDADLDVQPPKAKVPRREINANADSPNDRLPASQSPREEIIGNIPSGRMTKISNAQRQKDIVRKKNAGTDNRRSGTQAADLSEGIKVFGHGRIECFEDGKGRRYRLKGMAEETKLYEWQLNPVAWMAKRENGLAPPYGGVLADTMGMGKTLMSLACVVGNPPPEGDSQEFSGATLVIVPKDSVARQWQEQILKHVSCIKPEEVYYYKRLHHKVSGGDISRYKIV